MNQIFWSKIIFVKTSFTGRNQFVGIVYLFSEITPFNILYEEQDYFGKFPVLSRWLYKNSMTIYRSVHNFKVL